MLVATEGAPLFGLFLASSVSVGISIGNTMMNGAKKGPAPFILSIVFGVIFFTARGMIRDIGKKTQAEGRSSI